MGEENVSAEVAAMKSDIKNMMGLLVDIKDELKGLNQTYVPRSEVNEMFRSRDEYNKELKSSITADINNIKQNQNSSKQLIVAWAAVAVSIVALLLSFINK